MRKLTKKPGKTRRAAIGAYNTGHKHLDEVRRMVYKTCFLFVANTLKTNFFIPEKHALAFPTVPQVPLGTRS